MNFDAFISYASQDKAIADAACAKLEAEGIRCWIAPRDVPPGTQWAAAIVDAIDHCRAMVLIFSSSANSSKQIHREVQRAFDREVPVIPFRIENVAPEKSLAYYMGPVHWLDALTPPLEQHVQRLVQSVKPFAHTKTFGERENEALGRQEAEADKRAEIDPSQRLEPPKPWQPSRWSLLLACALAVMVVGGLSVWILASNSTRFQSPRSVVPSPASTLLPAPLIPPPPAPVQTPTTPVQPASSSIGPISVEREQTLKPKDSFKECDDCPEMVVVPAGSFTMGSPNNEKDRENNEGPQHQVTFAKPLAVGKYHITVGQFAAFVNETGYDAGSKCTTFWNGKFEEQQGRSWRNPGFAQRDLHPAVCLNWNDSKAYVAWLARTTGKAYRLLTEAEWEYAARARTEPGSYPRYWFGNDEKDLCRYGNVFDQTWKNVEGTKNWMAPCNDGYAHTSPVGSFAPNAFGLYDMLGNADQWTEDCYHDNYIGAPIDGSAWTTGDCNRRVFHGGSWIHIARYFRAAYRFGLSTTVRFDGQGLRVGRTLTP
jgi:formylglycine-generating enzyme required for sulfatase activity